MQKPPLLVHRSNKGLKLIQGLPPCDEYYKITDPDTREQRVEAIYCSHDGQFLAWIHGLRVKCIQLATRDIVFDVATPVRCNFVAISPKSTQLLIFGAMSSGDNLHIYRLTTIPKEKSEDGPRLIVSKSCKRASNWAPIYSCNEDVCLYQASNSELEIYAGGEIFTGGSGDETPTQARYKIRSETKIADFSLSTAPLNSPSYQHLSDKRCKLKTHHIAVHHVGVKGQPARVSLHKFVSKKILSKAPFNDEPIVSQSFFNTDSVKFLWSPSGQSLLLLCMSDVDRTGQSYYGEQKLHFLNIKGETYNVQLDKPGTIASLEWLPDCDRDMFVAVYGRQPASTVLFNKKCEMIFQLGEPSPYNQTYISPFGNLIALCGFGNLSGHLSVWDFINQKMIFNLKVPETTGFEWCPDGEHFITCTTSPRLRVGNGFRLWHYTGSLLYEQCVQQDSGEQFELYDLKCIPKPNQCKKPEIQPEAKYIGPYRNILAESTLHKYQKPTTKYVPPSFRAGGRATTGNLPDFGTGIGAGGRRIPGLDSLMKARQQNSNSNSNDSNKKSNKKKKEKRADQAAISAKIDGGTNNQKIEQSKQPQGKTPSISDSSKRIAIVKRKLDEITKLKKKKEAGDIMQQNQIVKINSEKQLLKELELLSIS